VPRPPNSSISRYTEDEIAHVDAILSQPARSELIGRIYARSNGSPSVEAAGCRESADRCRPRWGHSAGEVATLSGRRTSCGSWLQREPRRNEIIARIARWTSND
jgi:hypothetical protein